MSIIHDALKKVQDKAKASEPAPQAQTASAAPSAYPQPVEAAPTTSKEQKPLTLILAGTLSVAVIVIFLIIWNLFKETTTHGKTIAKPQTSEQPAPAPSTSAVIPEEKAPEPAPIPAQPTIDPNDPLSSIRIQGIMEMGNKKAALINDNIYE